MLKVKTGDDEIKDLKCRSEKHGRESILKCLKIDSQFYIKNYTKLNKKKVLLVITEIFIESVSIISSTMGLINPGAGIIFSSDTALLTPIAILITNEYISKLKLRYTKIPDWINVITLLYEKTLKTSRVDKKMIKKKLEI